MITQSIVASFMKYQFLILFVKVQDFEKYLKSSLRKTMLSKVLCLVKKTGKLCHSFLRRDQVFMEQVTPGLFPILYFLAPG